MPSLTGTVSIFTPKCPADTIWLDRAPLEAALAQSNTIVSTASTIVTQHLAQIPADNVEIELDVSVAWQAILQDIVRRSATLRYVTAVSSHTCSQMRPDGLGGMAVLITPGEVMGKSTSDIIEEFLNEAVPGRAQEIATIGSMRQPSQGSPGNFPSQR
jgi:hypothetical protein